MKKFLYRHGWSYDQVRHLKVNGIKLGLKQALEMHKLKVVQECEW